MVIFHSYDAYQDGQSNPTFINKPIFYKTQTHSHAQENALNYECLPFYSNCSLLLIFSLENAIKNFFYFFFFFVSLRKSPFLVGGNYLTTSMINRFNVIAAMEI